MARKAGWGQIIEDIECHIDDNKFYTRGNRESSEALESQNMAIQMALEED